jgi:ribosomal protein S18 acetylase RimI-like enzyme
MACVLIRDALPAELPEVGTMRVSAYTADGFMSPESEYAPELRELGADGLGSVLVAVDDVPGTSKGRLVGTVMLQHWPDTGHVVLGPGEAEIRALAVAPQAQGRGIGTALLTAIIERAAKSGIEHLVLCTQPGMRTAHRMYERAGFGRLPERDWEPVPGLALLAYGMRLTAGTRVRTHPQHQD